jgi:hypothetical protein
MGSDGSGSFEKYVNMLPVSPEKLVGSAISWYLKKQDPDDVTLDLYRNGYSITIKTDDENVKEMKEFWREFVEPKLGGNDE